MTKAARFTKADLRRAVEAMRAAGCCVAGAEIKRDGSILVLTEVARPANDTNPLDRMLDG